MCYHKRANCNVGREMSRFKFYGVLGTSLTLTACLSADSGVPPIGPNTYQLTVGRARAVGGGFAARKLALSKA